MKYKEKTKQVHWANKLKLIRYLC